jgi:hypothetical protein
VTDEFDALDEAEPVRSDADDSLDATVEQPEADAARHARETVGAGADVDHDAPARSKRHPTRFDAQCRHCRTGFDADRGDPLTHDCPQEPVSACRFCGETFTRRDDPELHVYGCDAAKRHVRGGSDLQAYVDPWYHEFKGYAKWDVRDRPGVDRESFIEALRTYFGLNSLQKEHDFAEHGRLRVGLEHEGDELTVAFGFKDCAIAPADHPEFRLDEVHEYLVYVYPAAYNSYEDAKSEGRARAYYRLSPRWPDLETADDAKPISNPHDIAGFDVEVAGTNFRFDRYPELLHAALGRLADRQGFRFNSYTPIRPDDLHPDRMHESSNVTDAELYVRVDRDLTGQVYAFDGTLHRISMLLGEERGGYAKTVRDDRECEGHYHVATIGTMRAGELLGGHELGKEFKHYHMKDPDAVEGTPLAHPKIGCALQNSTTDDTVYWSDLDRLERELDEGILNVLQWSDLPTEVGSGAFVADDYFEPTSSRRFRKLVDERLPRLKAQQHQAVWSVVGNMTETDQLLVDRLLTDGGQQSPADLADAIDRHLDTVYTALQRLGPIVEHTYGEVQLASKYVAQEVLKRIEGAKDAVQQSLRQSASDLVRANLFGDGDDPWSRWLDRYGVQVRGDDDRDVLDVGYTAPNKREARLLLRSGARRWAEVTGNAIRQFGLTFQPQIELADGSTYRPEAYQNALGTAG